MLAVERALLTYIKSNQPCPWIDVLNAVRPESEADYPTLNALLLCCVSSKNWVEKSAKPPECAVRLTPSGENALLADSEILRKIAAEKAQQTAEKERLESKRIKERAEDRADAERRYRTQNKIAVVMPFVTFFLGLIMEHFFGIVSALMSLVQ